MTSWYAHVSFTTPESFTETGAFDLLEALAAYAAAVAPFADETGAEVSFSIEADTIAEAATKSAELISRTVTSTGSVPVIESLEISTEAVRNRRTVEPVFPEVVGYAEIAEMAGVSRQRARQFAQYDTFPAPIITTAQGPLMAKTAVESWLAARNTRAGRPKVSG